MQVNMRFYNNLDRVYHLLLWKQEISKLIKLLPLKKSNPSLPIFINRHVYWEKSSYWETLSIQTLFSSNKLLLSKRKVSPCILYSNILKKILKKYFSQTNCFPLLKLKELSSKFYWAWSIVMNVKFCIVIWSLKIS